MMLTDRKASNQHAAHAMQFGLGARHQDQGVAVAGGYMSKCLADAA